MDETTLPIDDKKGWVWVLIGDFGVQIAIGPSRGKRFAEDIFGFYQGIPLVCDGYAVYNMFETIQRCWSLYYDIAKLQYAITRLDDCIKNCRNYFYRQKIRVK